MGSSKIMLVVLVISIACYCDKKVGTKRKGLREMFKDFKRHVNYNLLDMADQINSLSDNVTDLATAIILLHYKSRNDGKTVEKIDRGPETVSGEKDPLKPPIDEVYEDLSRKYTLLKDAFVSEKQFNRYLVKRLDAIEDSIATMYHDFANNLTSQVKTLISKSEENSNQTLKVSRGTESTTMANTRFEMCKNIPESGVYDIYIDSHDSPISVYCDKDHDDDHGWIVFLRRKDGSETFARPWADYKNGFGDLEGEFWAGNDLLHKLTKSAPMKMRVDMSNFNGDKAFAEYDQFQIGSEKEKYKLSVSGYNGTAGDSLIESINPKYIHDGAKFTTVDSDNDNASYVNCAEDYLGGWWFNSCFNSHLTGEYSINGNIRKYRGIIWNTWTGFSKGLQYVEIKLRY